MAQGSGGNGGNGGAGGNGPGDASGGPVLESVRARRFELVDDKGNVRIVLGTQPGSGAPGFLVSDAEGRARLALHVSAEGLPAIDLLDDTGAPRVHIALGSDGGPTVTLFGSPDQPAQVLLTVTADGAPQLRLAQADDGRTRLFWSLQPDGTPYVSLMDAEGRPRLSFALPGGNPALLMLDGDGRPRAVMSVTREDGPQFAVLTDGGGLAWSSARPPRNPAES